MLATPGSVAVACGTSVLGSGAGEGTSICGCCSTDCVGARLGRRAQRAPRKTTRSTARSPMTSLTAGFDPAAERGPGPETPGICGISVLKRSDRGWSVMWLRIDSILKEEKVDSPDKSVACDRDVVGSFVHRRSLKVESPSRGDENVWRQTRERIAHLTQLVKYFAVTGKNSGAVGARTGTSTRSPP